MLVLDLDRMGEVLSYRGVGTVPTQALPILKQGIRDSLLIPALSRDGSAACSIDYLLEVPAEAAPADAAH